MFSRVGATTLALVAAVAVGLSAAGGAGPVPGWWSGHPAVRGTIIKSKDVDIGPVLARGCNTGGDQSCQRVDVETVFAITGFAAGGALGILGLLSLALAGLAATGRERRKSVARAAMFTVVVAGPAAIALIVQGPAIVANAPDGTQLAVAVPLGTGTYLFAIGVVCAIAASVLALRPVAPRRARDEARAALPPGAPPAVDLQAILQDDALRPTYRSAPPGLAPAYPPAYPSPFAASGAPAPPAMSGGSQPPAAQPLFSAAPQLRPLYDADPGVGGTGGFVPAHPAPRAMRPPTPIPRDQISARAGIPTPPPIDAVGAIEEGRWDGAPADALLDPGEGGAGGDWAVALGPAAGADVRGGAAALADLRAAEAAIAAVADAADASGAAVVPDRASGAVAQAWPGSLARPAPLGDHEFPPEDPPIDLPGLPPRRPAPDLARAGGPRSTLPLGAPLVGLAGSAPPMTLAPADAIPPAKAAPVPPGSPPGARAKAASVPPGPPPGGRAKAASVPPGPPPGARAKAASVPPGPPPGGRPKASSAPPGLARSQSPVSSVAPDELDAHAAWGPADSEGPALATPRSPAISDPAEARLVPQEARSPSPPAMGEAAAGAEPVRPESIAALPAGAGEEAGRPKPASVPPALAAAGEAPRSKVPSVPPPLGGMPPISVPRVIPPIGPPRGKLPSIPPSIPTPAGGRRGPQPSPIQAALDHAAGAAGSAAAAPFVPLVPFPEPGARARVTAGRAETDPDEIDPPIDPPARPGPATATLASAQVMPTQAVPALRAGASDRADSREETTGVVALAAADGAAGASGVPRASTDTDELAGGLPAAAITGPTVVGLLALPEATTPKDRLARGLRAFGIKPTPRDETGMFKVQTAAVQLRREPGPSAESKVPLSTAPSTLPPPTDKQSSVSGPSPACPQCEAPMAWVEEHLRFYCKSCKMYF
jgi:hypothetical protein